MFDIQRFVQDCLDAARADGTHLGVRALMEQAMANPAAVVAALGEPVEGALQTLFRSDELTVLKVVWKPGAVIRPHNHQTWAVIGVYSGREDNIFWRRLPEGKRVEAAGAKALCVKDAAPLGPDIIHSVTNPIPRLTGAIHVYGGDFFRPEGRSEWDPETLLERPWDAVGAVRRFDRTAR